MKPENGVTQLALMRHSRTLWNEERLIQGWLDSPLSPQGVEQAIEWGKSLMTSGFNGILCSDLGRARKTADIINEYLYLPLLEDPRLRERNFGKLEGLHITSKVKMEHAKEGESQKDLRQRALAALRDAQRHGTKLLVVTHHGVVHSVLPYLAGPAHPLYKGRLLKSNRMHWVGARNNLLGVMQLNDRILQ